MSSLFRPEALAAQSRRSGEGIVLQRPRLFGLAASLALALIGLTIVFVLFGSYTSRVGAFGTLRADVGLATVTAANAGVVGKIRVPEGASTAAGEVLAVIESSRSAAGGREVGDEVAQQIAQRRQATQLNATAQLRMLQQREQGLQAHLAAIAEERRRMRDELSARERQATLARESLESVREVHRKGYISDLQLQQAEADALQRQSAVLGLQRELAATDRNEIDLRQALAELPQQRTAQQAGLAQELATLEQEAVENAARAGLSVKSPVTGIVTAQLIEVGQSVQAGQPMFAVLPQGALLEAHLLVPSRAVGFIEVGDEVRLRFQAFPYQKFGHQFGRVERVSKSALGPAELSVLLGRAEDGEPQYRVVVALERQTVPAYGKNEPLLPGMATEADILLERRALIEWMFEPLYSLHGRLAR